MYGAGGRGCGEEGPGGCDGGGGRLQHLLIKRDGLMTMEADGKSHLPWRRCQSLRPTARDGYSQRRGEIQFEIETASPFWRAFRFKATCDVEVFLAALWLAEQVVHRLVELGLGLSFRTLFGGNRAVNTKGLAVASLTGSFACVFWSGGVVIWSWWIGLSPI